MGTTAHAQNRYVAGDIVQDFSLVDRATGLPVKLSDLEGNVVFLEWFAWWCPFCQAAAAEIEPQIVTYYTQSGGNANGVPVKHVSVNLQGDQEASTEQFVQFYKLGLVLNDFDRMVADRFQAGGQPIFAIINGVANSPGHAQWELLYTATGYGQTAFPISTYRTVIDSVKAPEVSPPGPEADPPTIERGPVMLTVKPGKRAEFQVVATGTLPLAYQWRRNGVAIAGETAANLVVADVSLADAGDYDVVVTNEAGNTTTTAGRLHVDAAAEGRLVNLSSLAYSGSGVEQLVPSFVSVGPLQVLVRAVGPTLEDYGVQGRLQNPYLQVASGQMFVAENDNWGDAGDVAAAAIADVASTVGAFPLRTGSDDAALIFDYQGGPRSAPVSDLSGADGVALVEVYEVKKAGATGRLANLATRGLVRADGSLVAGFVIDGTAARTMLIRGVGPELTGYGVPGALADPRVTIASGGVVIAANDNWGDDAEKAVELAAVASKAGAFSLSSGSADAAILLTLPPGPYTVQVMGPTGAAGIVLAELYDVTDL